MELRFHLDPETGQPHIWDHGVTEEEVRQVMAGRGEDFRGERKSRVRCGRTLGGRYLKIFYVPDDEGDGVFVITAYELKAKELKAYRRRRRGKGQ
jgi:hypothetical protein